MTRDEIISGVTQSTVETLGGDRDKIALDSHYLDDLGADSLDAIEIIMDLEERFDVEISDDEAERVNTVGEAVDLIERLKAA